MRHLWLRAMMFFVVAFYALLFVSGLMTPKESRDRSILEKQRLVETIQQKEETAREHLMNDPGLLNAVSLSFLLVLAAGLAFGARALYCRLKNGHWPVESLSSLEVRWGPREVFQVLVLLLFVEACLFLLQAAFRILLELHGDVPDSFLLLGSLLRDCVILGCVWALVRFIHNQGFRELGLRFEKAVAHLRTGFIAYLATIPVLLVVFTVTAWVTQAFSLQPEPQGVVQLYLKPSTERFLIPLTFFVALLGPVMEEVLFRGFAFAGLKKRFGVLGGACVSSAAFAAMHMNWAVFVPVFVLGMILTYLYEHSGSLVPSITLHILHNVVMVALTLGFKELSS